jgi:CheY-like chemotaxis protein
MSPRNEIITLGDLKTQIPNNQIKGVKVLVVEDVELNQLLIKTFLVDYGFECDFAENGKVGIEKLKENTYDIILMDLQMPAMNGFEATDYIRNTMNSKIPIIALTADVTTVDFAKCKAFGMDDYISKPVDDRELYSKIAFLVNQPTLIAFDEPQNNQNKLVQTSKYIDLLYLNQRTKSDSKLMMEMIAIYLAQTPPLIKVMKESLLDKDWNRLQSAVHKMIPSFSIMGISKDFENIALRVQEDANNIQLQTNGLSEMVDQLENICEAACKELEEEFNEIKKGISA